MFLLGATENPEEIAESIYNVYPDLRAPDNFTRNLAASRSCTEWFFSAYSNLEAKEHHRYLSKIDQVHIPNIAAADNNYNR